MSLPTPWIDRIFAKLTLTYGQQFLRRWQDIDLNDVKSDWGHELAGFAQHPRAIAWALQHLPIDRPPTVLEFRALARKAPPEDVPKLESPKADAAIVAAELAKLAPVLRQTPRQGVDGRAWARAILARFDAGERINPTTLRFAKEALRAA
jgi:hypothetical protein